MWIISVIRRRWKLYLAFLAIVVILVIIGHFLTTQIRGNRVGYQCMEGACVRVRLNPHTRSYSSRSTCNLNCHRPSFVIWPEPRLISWPKGRPVTAVNPNLIEFSTESLKNPPMATALQKVFQSRLVRKIPMEWLNDSREGKGVIVTLQLEETSKLISKNTYADESYVLKTSYNSANHKVLVAINAKTISGIQHGLQTLNQLTVFDESKDKLLVRT